MDFLNKLLTGDKLCIHRYNSEDKKGWIKFKYLSVPDVWEFKTQSSTEDKVMPTKFWDAESLVYTEFVQNGININSDYCDIFQTHKIHTTILLLPNTSQHFIFFPSSKKVPEKLNLILIKKFNSQFGLGYKIKVGNSMPTVFIHAFIN